MSYDEYQVITTPNFKQSFKKIVEYYYEVAHQGVSDDFANTVEGVATKLTFMPYRYAVSHFDDDYRKVKVGRFPYIIYYVVVKDIVVLLDVIHAHKNVTSTDLL